MAQRSFPVSLAHENSHRCSSFPGLAEPITFLKYAGKKYKVSGTPMTPLAELVGQACQQMPQHVDPASCTLKLGKKTLALTDPVRFAALPRNAVLTMESSAPLTLLSMCLRSLASKAWAKLHDLSVSVHALRPSSI